MDLEHQGSNVANVLVALITNYGLRVIGAIAILAGGWIASRMIHAAIVRLCLRSPRIDRTVALFLANGARYGVLVFTTVAVLTSFGIATTSLVAVLGAMGLAIGLALQGTLSNLAAGIMIVLFRPFRVGDRVESAGIAGTIQEINLFYSELDSDDNVRVVFPNGLLWGQIVKVPSRNDTQRVELKFARPLTDDVGTAIGRIEEVVHGDARIMQTPRIGVDAVSDGGFVLLVRLWTRRTDAQQVRFDVNRAVKEAFQRTQATARD